MKVPPQSDPTTAPPGAAGVVVIGDRQSAGPYLRSLSKLRGARVIGRLDPSIENGATDTTVQTTDDPAVAAGWDGVDAFIHCGRLANDPVSVAMIAASKKPVFIDSRAGRHRADAQTVRARIEAGEIGRVVFARFAAGIPSADAPTHSDGEPLIWERAQVLDVLGWWIGDDPHTVYAQRSLEYESVTVRYTDGATAVYDITSAGPAYRELGVVGTLASMSVAWPDHTSMLLPASGSGVQFLDGSTSLDAVLDEWLDRVRTGTAPIVDASELRAAIALDEAIELSVRSGRAADAQTSQGEGRRP